MEQGTNWIKLLQELEREEMELRTQEGDIEAMKDLNFIIKHPGEAKDVIEARQKRKVREAQIRHGAAEMKAAKVEARERARKESLEAYAVANSELLILSINGERVKWKKWNHLKCPTCGEPSDPLKGLVLEVAEELGHYAEAVRTGRGAPPFKIQNTKCLKCGKELIGRCQGVIL